jgi:hypothetical protein
MNLGAAEQIFVKFYIEEFYQNLVTHSNAWLNSGKNRGVFYVDTACVSARPSCANG